jgi:hypothetical protein
MKHLTALALIVSVFFLGCSKSSTTTPGPTSAAFTLGSGGSCTGAVLSGTYKADTALTSANTVSITVTVTTVGPYSISTDTVNGISFSKKDTFTLVGPQNVVLTGTGTPVAADTANFTITSGSNSCTFSVTTLPAGPPPGNFITCDLNGVYTNFSSNITATNSATENGGTGTAGLFIAGYDTAITSATAINLAVGTNSSIVGLGTYTVLSNPTAFFAYLDASSNIWAVNINSPFQIVVTTVNATNVQGTFFGVIKDQQGAGTNSIGITNGVFNVPLH